MATNNKVIITQDGSFLDNGELGGTNKKLQLIVQYEQFLSKLTAGIGFLPQETEFQKEFMTMNSGNAIYFKSTRILTENSTNGSGAFQTAEADTLEVALDVEKQIRYELNLADLVRMGAQLQGNSFLVNEAIVNNSQRNAITGQKLYVGAKYTTGLINACKTNSFVNNQIIQINLPVDDLINKQATNEDCYKYVWNTLYNYQAKLRSLVTTNIIGIPVGAPPILEVSPEAKKYLIGATTILGSNSAREALMKDNVTNIADINVAYLNYLGKKFLKNTASALDKDEDFDCSEADMILRISGSYVCPINMFLPLQTKADIDTRNPKSIARYLISGTGGKPLYNEYIIGFKINFVAKNKAQEILNKITNPRITVPSATDPSTSKATTITTLKSVIQAYNPTLTASDLATFSFATKTLVAGEAIPVLLTSTVTTQTATQTILIELAKPASTPAPAPAPASE